MRSTFAIISLLFLSHPATASNTSQQDVENIKNRILTIAKSEFASKADKLVVRNILDPLVNNLIEKAPSQTEAQRAPLVAGGWKSLWSDQVFGFGVDLDQVYQVVSPDGFYYNISKVDSPMGTFTNFLRGAYTTQGSYLSIEFTANALADGFFPDQTNLTTLANDFEQGSISSNPIPGPIGVTGVLMNIFVDKNLRIVYGNSSVDSRPRLFILERSENIEIP